MKLPGCRRTRTEVELPARGIRLFSHAQAQPRARRPTDFILLGLSLLGLLVVGVAAEPEPGYSHALTELLVSLPDALDGLWRVFADIPIVWSVVIFAIALARGGVPSPATWCSPLRWRSSSGCCSAAP